MQNTHQNPQPIETHDQLILYLNFQYGVRCRACDGLVLEPDKVKGQLYLKGRCPSCGQDSAPPQTKSTKRERKNARREAKRLAKIEKLIAIAKSKP
jgi:hypothetical protein